MILLYMIIKEKERHARLVYEVEFLFPLNVGFSRLKNPLYRTMMWPNTIRIP